MTNPNDNNKLEFDEKEFHRAIESVERKNNRFSEKNSNPNPNDPEFTNHYNLVRDSAIMDREVFKRDDETALSGEQLALAKDFGAQLVAELGSEPSMDAISRSLLREENHITDLRPNLNQWQINSAALALGVADKRKPDYLKKCKNIYHAIKDDFEGHSKRIKTQRENNNDIER